MFTNETAFIAKELENNSISDISSICLDTYLQEDLFYSYRRSIHKKERDYGRMISTITIKGDHS